MSSTGLVDRVNRLASRAARLPGGFRDIDVWRALDALLLEDRILLSAAPIDTAVIDTLAGTGADADLAEAGLDEVPTEGDGAAPSAADVSHEIAFVDPSAGDAQQFLTDLAEQIEAGRQIEVVLLDAGRDGLAQITEVLSARTADGLPELDAVHIIAHGNERSVRLGSEWLRVDGVEARLDEFQAWDDALADGGDILFYSCDLAATQAGQAMLQTLSLTVGGDVAASTDDTGAASLGGDWTLEFSTGTIEASLAVSADMQQEFDSLLATFTVTNTTNSGAGSLRKAIQDANANPGADIIDFNISLSDPGHFYYRDDGIAGSLSLVAATTLADGAITDFDPDYPAAPYSWYSISLSSALPALTDTVTIDATTQPGFSLYPIIELDGNGLATHGLEIQAGGTVIRGLVINQFGLSGIQITSGNGNVIQGNFIGTDVSGTIDRGNGVDGLDIRTDNNTIGGTTVLARNVISGNQDDGIDLDSASGNLILGNYIGVDVTGTRLLGNNSDGVLLELGAHNNTIGGTGAGEGNIIAGNGGDGVFIDGSNTGNAIRGNSIYSNAGLGIDLGSNGITSNDANDTDSGANNLQNYPVITAVLTNATTTTISGTFHSTTNGTFDLDFYANSAGDGSGHGEGQTYLGSDTVTTDASGNGSFTVVFSSGVASGAVVSATATDAAGNTSEFSAWSSVVLVNNAPVLDNTGSMTLTDVVEDAANPVGDTVAAILASAGGDRVTDADSGAAEGIAVVGVDDTNGQWQYNTGGGWVAFGAVSNNSAVLLDTAALIRFVPSVGYSGPAGDITFRAWDQTDGNFSGDTGIDVSTSGGTTAYSAATETATLNVNPFNDAPVLDNTGSMSLTAIGEDDTASAGDAVSAILASAGGDRITDADAGAVEGIAVVGVDDANGQWQYDVGGGWTAFGAVSDNSAVLLDTTARIRFVPSTNYNGSAGNLTFRAWDQTDGNASGDTSVDVSANGGTTAYSSATETATLAINSVNDAPVLDNTGTMSLTDISEDNTTSAGNTVAGIIGSAGGDPITDADSGAVEGIAVTGVDNTNGQWQYNTGSGWVAFGTVSSNNAVLLDAAARIRFVPSTNYNGPAGDITFRAWDQTDGNASGATGVDVSLGGGAAAYSTATESAALNVTAVNDAPVHSVPAAQTTSEDTPLTFSAASGNALSIGDADAGASAVQVSLNVTNGRLSLAQTAGLVFSTGDGTADASLTFTGSLSDINAALDGLTYDPNPNYSGPDSLSIVTSDLGNSGGGPLVDVDAVAITVTFVGTQPVAQSDSARLFAAPSLFVPAAGVLGNDSDVDGQPLSAVLVSAPQNGSVVLNADGSFTYAPTPGFFGYDTFRYAADDGILPSAPATVTVLVVPGIVAPPAGGGGGGGGDSDDGGDEFAGTSPDGGQPDPEEQDEQEDDSSSTTEQYVGGSPDGGPPVPRRFVRLLGDAEVVAEDDAPADLPLPSLLVTTAQIDGDAAGVFRTASLVGGAASGGLRAGGLAGSHTTLAALSEALQFDAGILFERLDQLEDAVDRHGQTLQWIVGSAAATTTVLASGYVFWLVRGGYLFAGLLSSMPAWYRFDPLPVLQSGGALAAPAGKSEDDSLEELLGNQRKRVRSNVPGEPGTKRDHAKADAT